MRLRRYFRTENYFVAPADHTREVVAQFNLPEKVEIHDSTLRDGEQQAGVAFTLDDKVRIAELLAEAGIHRIEAGMPASSKVDEDAIRAITKRNLGPKIFAFSRATEKDIRLASDLGVDGVALEIPVNEELIRFGYRWPKERALESVLQASSLAHELGLHVDLFLMDSSRLTSDEFISRVSEIQRDGWVDSCSLVDTQGVLSTPAVHYLVRKARAALNIPIEAHFHNDLGLAVGNTLAAFEEGASALHTTVLGLGPRAGQAATEQIALALRLLYGVDIGIKLDKLYALGKEVGEISKFKYPVNQPVVGDVLYTLESGMPASWWRNIKDDHPLSFYGILPELINRPAVQIALGKSSGNASILFWLEKLDLTLADPDSIGEILQKVKSKAVEKRGSLNEEEFLEIVQAYC